MCMDIFLSSGQQQPLGAPRTIQFTSEYQVLEPRVSQQGPGGPGTLRKGFLRQSLIHIGTRLGIGWCP